jgi:DNA-binding response OmpR family regulator
MNAHSTIRTSLDPWLGEERCVCVVQSRRNGLSSVTDVLTCSAGYRATSVLVGRSMADEFTATDPDIVVIDASTDDFDAARLCRDVHRTAGVPIVAVLPAEREADDRAVIELLDAGASDVVSVDVSADRLLAHMRAALRQRPKRESPPTLVAGDVVVDLGAHVVTIDGRVVSCPPLLFSMLATLASAPNKVTTRDVLLAKVWGVEPGAVDTRRVRVAASLLRRMLGTGPRRPRLETVSRIGYRLAVD